jgi:hypothetical protein
MSDIKQLDEAPVTFSPSARTGCYTITVPGNYKIDVPEGYLIDTSHLDHHGDKMFYNDYDKTEKLKAKCWICQKDAKVHQIYNFVTAKEKVTISCCQKEQVVELTEKQIKETNAQGVYWAFMC